MEESISDIKLYKDKIDDKLNNIYIKYIMLIKEYIEHFNQNHKNEYNEYYKYLMIRGLQTMCTLFNMLFLYLKNLDITYKHCQQGIFYYVEFIGQIGNDNGGFLQLSSKDAVLFVYKKTLFDINLEHKKKYELSCKNEEDLIYMVDKFSLCLNILFEKMISSSVTVKKDFNDSIDKIINLCNYIPDTSNHANKEKIDIIYAFLNKLSIANFDVEFHKYTESIEHFFKKVNKMKTKKNIISLINSIQDGDIYTHKCINKLFL
jgi:hypothetical protein